MAAVPSDDSTFVRGRTEYPRAQPPSPTIGDALENPTRHSEADDKSDSESSENGIVDADFEMDLTNDPNESRPENEDTTAILTPGDTMAIHAFMDDVRMNRRVRRGLGRMLGCLPHHGGIHNDRSRRHSETSGQDGRPTQGEQAGRLKRRSIFTKVVQCTCVTAGRR